VKTTSEVGVAQNWAQPATENKTVIAN